MYNYILKLAYMCKSQDKILGSKYVSTNLILSTPYYKTPTLCSLQLKNQIVYSKKEI